MKTRLAVSRSLLSPAALLVLACRLPGAVLITEVHYNAPEGGDLEYVEVHNDGAAPEDVSGWAFTDGISFAFPQGVSIAPGAYLVLCKSREALLASYPALPEAAIAGTFDGSLANEGERITLSDSSGAARQSFDYDDDPPWDFLADGFGASLERICFGADPALPENWRASAVPPEGGRSGGTLGAPNRESLCPPAAPPQPRVLISEVMYHPVLEEALEDYHEFVEIHNAGAEEVALAGWRLAGGIDFTFPAGASIGPGAYRVVAKDRAKLAAVASYALNEADLFGDYARTLDNGGDKVALIGAEGQGVDSMSYDDDAPWPAGADALGAQEDWLAPELLPLEGHRYRGISLERVSFGAPSGEIANWAPSPVDGATPGRPNASARAVPLPVAADSDVHAAAGGNDPLIREGQEVRVQVLFSPRAPAGPVEIEYFVDLVMTSGEEPVAALPMFDDGKSGGDLVAGDLVYTALLPGLPENSVVRYRVLADRGEGRERVAPRPTDPNAWNAYFVSPVIDTATRVYQLLIHPADWGKMWTGIQGGRASGCRASETWDRDYPAVFVHEGRVIDARVRYQGSRWNRTNGPAISSWPYPKPVGGPSPLRALSWRISMPRYNQLEGLSEIILNKLTQGCPGYNAGVGYRLFDAVDLPGSLTRFVRLHVNGGYYHYMIELERPGEEMMRRFHRQQARKHPDAPPEKVGHLFKSAGCNCDEGPYGWGDERVLLPTCGFTKEQRYGATYDRKTHGWGDYAEFSRMIDDLNAARRSGLDAIRDYLAERFDLDRLLDYVAIMNWSVPFDDMFQNHFLYQRRSDGKWLVFPWDLDQNFGEWKQAGASIYMGEQNDPDNRSAWWNYLKDAVLKAYRDEFDGRLLLLNNTVLHPDNIARLVDAVTAQANPAEAAKAPAGVSCSFPGRAASFKQFALQRYAVVNSKVAGVSLDAGAPQTVYAGSPVQFDARASKPDPSPDTPYTWDNGMTGDYPTFVYDTAGQYTVTLTVTVRGIAFTDSVAITVLSRPALAFRETAGQVVMEAESFHENERHAAAHTWWDADASSPGFSGASYMQAKEDARQTFLQKYAAVSPELRYAVLFETPGTYRVWIRALTLSAQADSVYVGLEGQERNAKYAQEFAADPNAFLWSGDTRSKEPQVLEVTQPGLWLFSVWVRESGQIIDKVILTRDLDFTPADAGPPESAQVPAGGARTFIRGDADGSGRLNVTDAIAILRHLFQGAPLACEDPADADDSGKLDLSDAIGVLFYLFLRGPAPAPPYPQPGVDATEDGLACGG